MPIRNIRHKQSLERKHWSVWFESWSNCDHESRLTESGTSTQPSCIPIHKNVTCIYDTALGGTSPLTRKHGNIYIYILLWYTMVDVCCCVSFPTPNQELHGCTCSWFLALFPNHQESFPSILVGRLGSAGGISVFHPFQLPSRNWDRTNHRLHSSQTTRWDSKKWESLFFALCV